MSSQPIRNREEGQFGGRRFFARPHECAFCTDKSAVIDYKLVEVLRRYVTDDGKIRPRRQTGICAKHQRALARAIKRARHVALLPFSSEVLR
ncbi:MAG: 30S ribosomal protein S18 [Anaerolineae bacterium]|mgnify:CR=1 FL=1|nr:30S ribosomal protein S18 [Anaerolineae bacterium]MCZ7553355.1 30S ribosomal protein S18 [Anaerolineales bacterium]